MTINEYLKVVQEPLVAHAEGVGVDGGGNRHESAECPYDGQDHEGHQPGGSRVEGGHDCPSPVQRDGQHGQHRGRDRAEGDELVEGAVEGAKVPLSKSNIYVYFVN